MVIKVGKFGPFIACSAYPECTNTKELETQRDRVGSEEERDEPCENCGKPMVVKRGRFGQFLACTGYPECKTTRKLIATKGRPQSGQAGSDSRRKVPALRFEPRDQAGAVRRVYRVHEISGMQVRQAEVDRRRIARRTAATIVERKSRRGKTFFGCANYPDCEFTLWKRPFPEKCPDCGAPFLVESVTKRHGRQLICNNEKCEYVRSEELVDDASA